MRRYAVAAALMVAAALITRFGNQPINAEVMNWTPGDMPADWQSFRERWWYWHIVRTMVSLAATTVLISAVLADQRFGKMR